MIRPDDKLLAMARQQLIDLVDREPTLLQQQTSHLAHIDQALAHVALDEMQLLGADQSRLAQHFHQANTGYGCHNCRLELWFLPTLAVRNRLKGVSRLPILRLWA